MRSNASDDGSEFDCKDELEEKPVKVDVGKKAEISWTAENLILLPYRAQKPKINNSEPIISKNFELRKFFQCNRKPKVSLGSIPCF